MINPKSLLHIEHLEDVVFSGDVERGRSVLNLFDDLFYKRFDDRFYFSLKWDGSPSLFLGRNPENKKFFVATKSIFNKERKLNYTTKDIDKNHTSPELKKVLKVACQVFGKPL